MNEQEMFDRMMAEPMTTEDWLEVERLARKADIDIRDARIAALEAELAPWREMGPAFAEAVKQIRDERDKQNRKWGEQNHDGGLWLKILMEEVGELSQAMLHDEFGGPAAGTVDAELVQVAAVAVQWMECRRRLSAVRGG